jgi:hypothetical protein
MMFRIFSRRKKLISNKKIKAEAVAMQQVLSQASSFKSFCNYSEAFDMNRRTMITGKNNLLHLYAHGIGIDSPVFIINKN